jgi:hypothetical protein
MAARAHAVHDYSFAGASQRQRRQVWLRDDDEIVLPRGRGTQITGALLLSAALASALVGGAAYAVYRATAPTAQAPVQLGPAPAGAPLFKEWQPDRALEQANVARAMQGPALATPAVAQAVAPSDDEGNLPEAAPAMARERESREVIIDDSSPGLQESLPQPPAPDVAEQPELTQPSLPDPILPKKEAPSSPDSPYPNPTTTPPEMSQPPADSWPDLPKLDTNNPY